MTPTMPATQPTMPPKPPSKTSMPQSAGSPPNRRSKPMLPTTSNSPESRRTKPTKLSKLSSETELDCCPMPPLPLLTVTTAPLSLEITDPTPSRAGLTSFPPVTELESNPCSSATSKHSTRSNSPLPNLLLLPTQLPMEPTEPTVSSLKSTELLLVLETAPPTTSGPSQDSSWASLPAPSGSSATEVPLSKSATPPARLPSPTRPTTASQWETSS